MAGEFRPPGADPRPDKINLNPQTLQRVDRAVDSLDRWLDTQRQSGGYSGPVVHWWRDCLSYTGPGLDWRYEGIIIGYINLWAIRGNIRWLEKACLAGDDLLAGQLPSGNFRNSCFEQNPNSGGTPHEAACDLGLLHLVFALQQAGLSGWESYLTAARRNLDAYYLARLWNPATSSFWDTPEVPSFVPNKAATLSEALFALAYLTGEDTWIEQYALPTLKKVLSYQERGGSLDGAICQNTFDLNWVKKYFPYYISRCIPALLLGWRWTQDERYAEAARRAAEFVHRTRYPDGSFPQVVYPAGRVNRYPQWVAAVGDILRSLEMARIVDFDWNPEPSLAWLLAGQRPDGSFRTAVGFGQVTPTGNLNDPRDELSVTGWCDKAFRFLSNLSQGESKSNN